MTAKPKGRLSVVAMCARDVAVAQEKLAEAIRADHALGRSLRAIAQDANISHEQVRRIIAQ